MGEVDSTPNGATVSTPASQDEVVAAARHLTKDYPLPHRQRVRAVRDVSFSVHLGETFGLVGETGSGKSTTGRLMLGLERPTAGSAEVLGRDLASLRPQQLRDLRREMQPVPQDPYSALSGRMRVSEILAEPYLIHKTTPRSQLGPVLHQLLETVGLPADSLQRFPHEFSGGQRQRIAIARAIALRPRFLVCDEPLSALDMSVQAEIINLLVRLQREFRLTYLFISHDLEVVRWLADRVGVLYRGHLVELGDSEALFARPRHPYTQSLLASTPTLDPRHRRRPSSRGDAGEVDAGQGGDTQGCVFAAKCPLAESRCRAEAPPAREVEPNRVVACHLA